jgi:hypothetical protein
MGVIVVGRKVETPTVHDARLLEFAPSDERFKVEDLSAEETQYRRQWCVSLPMGSI